MVHVDAFLNICCLNMKYSKYKFMESQLVQQQKGLLTKIPDIESALAALRHLQKQDADKV